MDPVTHTLTGVALSRAGLNRFTPHATLLLVLASNAPDIDVVTGFLGSTAYLDYHRGPTHTVWCAPLVALLPVALLKWGFRRPIPFLPAWALSTLVAWLHLALDFFTAYGTRPFAPFSTTWMQWPVLFIFDAAIVAVLALAVIAPALSRLVSGEIGARKTTGRGWAIFALAFVLCWIGFKGLMRDRAVQMLTGRMYQGKVPQRVQALPTALNPFVWTGLIETEAFLSIHSLNVLQEFDPEDGRLLVKPRFAQAIAAARRAPQMSRFLDFAQWPAFRVIPLDEPEGALRIEVRDIRFGRGFNASVTLDKDLRVLSETVNGG